MTDNTDKKTCASASSSRPTTDELAFWGGVITDTTGEHPVLRELDRRGPFWPNVCEYLVVDVNSCYFLFERERTSDLLRHIGGLPKRFRGSRTNEHATILRNAFSVRHGSGLFRFQLVHIYAPSTDGDQDRILVVDTMELPGDASDVFGIHVYRPEQLPWQVVLDLIMCSWNDPEEDVWTDCLSKAMRGFAKSAT